MTDLRTACQECLTSGGDCSRDDVTVTLGLLTDHQLAADMIDGWFSESDPHGEVYGPNGPPSIEQATAMFADLRSDLSWLDKWRLAKARNQ